MNSKPVHGVLVGCGNAKRDERAVAKDLYTSNYFQLKREYAEERADIWRIISAEHGIIHPNRPVDPYDTTLDDLGDAERREWMNEVAEDLHDLHIEEDVDYWTFLVGGDYRVALRDVTTACRITHSYAPTAGMSIGKRMEWLAAEVDGKEGEKVVAGGNR